VPASGGCRVAIATVEAVVPSSPLALMLLLFTVRWTQKEVNFHHKPS
jgi:hypothetical protein